MSSYHFTSAGFSQQPPGRSPDRGPGAEPMAYAARDRSQWALLGESVAVRHLRSQIRRVAPYFRTALIRGEAGSGKELVARAIHALSSGAEGPFIVADAGALAESADRGEADSATSTLSAAQVLESAHGGTLYLTPVGGLSFRQQAALARLLRAGEQHLGNRGTGMRIQGPRILAASDRDLRTLAVIGQFRQDLYARLSALEIFVPPLRQRIEDIQGLVEWLLRGLAEESGRGPTSLAESAVFRLQRHPWPNNLRELERVVTEAAALTQGPAIEARHLLEFAAPRLAELAATSPRKTERLHDVVQRHVLEVLTQCEGNKLRAAELLGISRSTLYRMLSARSASDRCT